MPIYFLCCRFLWDMWQWLASCFNNAPLPTTWVMSDMSDSTTLGATSSFTLLKCQRYSALLDGLSFAPNGLHQHWWCCHCLYRQLCSSRQCSQLLPKKTRFKKWESRDWSLLLYLFICLLLFLVLNSTLEECEGEQGACVTAHLQVLNSTLEGCEGEQGACVTAHLQVQA